MMQVVCDFCGEVIKEFSYVIITISGTDSQYKMFHKSCYKKIEKFIESGHKKEK